MKQGRPVIVRSFKPRKSAFPILSVLPHLIFIAILIGIYYYLWQNDLFYNYLNEIYIGLKVVIACDIFIASISSMLAPLIALIAGLIMLYLSHNYTFSMYANAWQLVIMSGVGFIIRILVR